MESKAWSAPPGMRVLLVEDEPLIALDGEDMLRAAGVDEVVCARTLGDAVQALDGMPFDAAFLDLRLGAESSVPLAQRLAALGVPFAFMTGFRDDSLPEDLKDRPVVQKPFTPQQLAGQLQRLVGQS